MSNLPEFNQNSNHHVSLLFFGGMLPVKETQEVGYYKNGKVKTQQVTVLKPIRGLGFSIKDRKKTLKEGIYSVDEEVIQTLLEENKSDDANRICELMLEIRGLEKLIKTYFTSVQNLIYPEGLVHPEFNHVATETGRLSSKHPNVQNQPTDERVLEHFISRFEDGRLISADYKSIEPRCEAQMSGDIMKISDIINGVDDHTKNLALKEGIDYNIAEEKVKSGEWEKKRSEIKGFTFAVQYDASAKPKSISYNSGLDVELVANLLIARRRAYPKLHLYYDWLQAEINRKGEYSDPWGRRYKFKKYPPRKGETQEKYNNNQIQNYRTQGFATATIVLSMIGLFWREKAIYNREKYLMINTVHDSLMLDCRKKDLENAKKDLTILTEADKISKEKFNYNFIVPIEIDISEGSSWSDL